MIKIYDYGIIFQGQLWVVRVDPSLSGSNCSILIALYVLYTVFVTCVSNINDDDKSQFFKSVT